MSAGAPLSRSTSSRSFLKKKPQKFQSWYLKWTKAIRDEAKPLGFLEPESLKARNIFYAVSAARRPS